MYLYHVAIPTGRDFGDELAPNVTSDSRVSNIAGGRPDDTPFDQITLRGVQASLSTPYQRIKCAIQSARATYTLDTIKPSIIPPNN